MPLERFPALYKAWHSTVYSRIDADLIRFRASPLVSDGDISPPPIARIAGARARPRSQSSAYSRLTPKFVF
eukprot:scaffold1066_cov421-Prasinococcus_capsulatus_cf.AAC.9